MKLEPRTRKRTVGVGIEHQSREIVSVRQSINVRTDRAPESTKGVTYDPVPSKGLSIERSSTVSP